MFGVQVLQSIVTTLMTSSRPENQVNLPSWLSRTKHGRDTDAALVRACGPHANTLPCKETMVFIFTPAGAYTHAEQLTDLLHVRVKMPGFVCLHIASTGTP